MAEWSKALALGTSHFSGVGSNPTPVIFIFILWYVVTAQQGMLKNKHQGKLSTWLRDPVHTYTLLKHTHTGLWLVCTWFLENTCVMHTHVHLKLVGAAS